MYVVALNAASHAPTLQVPSATGQTGQTGETGKTGEGTTVIVEPSPAPKTN